MAPPKTSKGKENIGEVSNAPDSDPEQFQPSLKQRRMMSSFRQCNVLLPKFGKIDTFPYSSFQAMRFDINFLKQQHHHHNEGVE